MLAPLFDCPRVVLFTGFGDGDGKVPLIVRADEINKYKVKPRSVNIDAILRGQLKHWNLNESP